MGIETWIWTLRQGFWPQGWNMGLKAEIWASMLGCPPGWGFGLEAEGGYKEGGGDEGQVSAYVEA